MHSLLLVDDEPHVIDGLRHILRGQPYRIFTADSGEGALRILANSEIDVVVCDQKMPGMSGVQLLTQVRQDYPQIARILLTGQPSLESAIEAINAAAIFHFLTKPCKPQDLIACLQKAVGSGQTDQPPTQAEQHSGLSKLYQSAVDGLWIAYQPIVSMRSRSLYGYEALLRTEEPRAANPLDFLAMAKTLSHAQQLEHTIWERIVDDVAALDAPIHVFVNLSPASLGDDRLYQKSSPLSKIAQRVVLEITERMPLSTIDNLSDRLLALNNMGFRIAVDDLGSGYSGLTSLSLLQPDVVKFDMGIIRDIDKSTINQRLVQSIVEVCRDLGIQTVAEGVETQAELGQLLDVNCSLYQGYLFARPQPPFSSVLWPQQG